MRRLVAGAIVLFSGVAVATAESGRTAATLLTRTQSAVPAALGGAYTAVSGNLDGVAYNPAGAATAQWSELQATYLHGFADDALGSLRYGQTLKFGTVFVGGDYYDAGTIDLNLSDGTTGSRRAEQDSVGEVGLALGREFPVSIGGTLKAYRLRLAEEASATGTAFDAGALWRTPISGLNVGLAGTNMGSDVKFEEQGDPLPVTARAGLAYALNLARFSKLRDYPYVFTAIVDGVKEKDENSSVRAGLDITRALTSFADTAGSASFRFGYQSRPQTMTAGIGFRLAGFGLDYAFNLINGLDANVHRATISWRFLSWKEALAEGAEIKPRQRRRSTPQ